MVEDGCDRYLVSDVTCVLTRCTRKAGSGEGQRLHGFFMYFIQAIAEVVRGGLILGVTLGGKLQVSGCFEDSFTSFVCAKRFRQFVCSCVCVSSRLTTHDSRLSRLTAPATSLTFTHVTSALVVIVVIRLLVHSLTSKLASPHLSLSIQ